MTTKHPSLGNNHVTSPPRFWIVSPGRAILFLITAVVLLYGVVYPNAHIVISSLRQNGTVAARDLSNRVVTRRGD